MTTNFFSGEFKGGRRRKPKSCLSWISKLETIQTVINQLPIYPQVSELEKYVREKRVKFWQSQVLRDQRTQSKEDVILGNFAIQIHIRWNASI